MAKIKYPMGEGAEGTLDLTPGCPIFLVGPNGAGKTRMLNYIRENFDGETEYVSGFSPHWRTLHPNTEQAEGHETKIRIQNVVDILYQPYYTHDMCQAKFHRMGLDRNILWKCQSLLESLGLRPALDLSEDSNLLQSISEERRLYSPWQMSDGERRILFIAATVFTAKEDACILIEHPEQFLYPSIDKLFVEAIVKERSDCVFVFATHAIHLCCRSKAGGENTKQRWHIDDGKRLFVMRGCRFDGNRIRFDGGEVSGNKAPDYLSEWLGDPLVPATPDNPTAEQIPTPNKPPPPAQQFGF